MFYNLDGHWIIKHCIDSWINYNDELILSHYINQTCIIGYDVAYRHNIDIGLEPYLWRRDHYYVLFNVNVSWLGKTYNISTGVAELSVFRHVSEYWNLIL